MTVIEADGLYLDTTSALQFIKFYVATGIPVHPYVVDSLPIFPAQRYSVVVSIDRYVCVVTYFDNKDR